MILDRLRNGTLIVCFDTLRIYSTWKAGGKLIGRKQRLAIYPAGRDGEYRSIRLRASNCRINIVLQRLAWLAHTMRPIPDGYEIHHVNTADKCNWHWSNLECLSRDEHLARHADEPFEPFT